MSSVIKYLMISSLVLFLSGFSMNDMTMKQVVSEDYKQYLANNEGNFPFPQTNYVAEYILTPSTVNHNYEFRSGLTGYVNLWIVNFGDILEKTLQGKDMQSAFKQLSKSAGEGSSGKMTIKYHLIDYKFEELEARLRLQISVLKGKTTVFDETYFEKGQSQGGKMFWTGAFGMKNSIQQSTKNAIDKILAKSLHDMMSKNIR